MRLMLGRVVTSMHRSNVKTFNNVSVHVCYQFYITDSYCILVVDSLALLMRAEYSKLT